MKNKITKQNKNKTMNKKEIWGLQVHDVAEGTEWMVNNRTQQAQVVAQRTLLLHGELGNVFVCFRMF